MEFKNTLHPDVQSILEFVSELTKKKIKFVVNDELVQYAVVKIARSNMDEHIIVYKSEHNELINHLIAHECGHIIRMYQTPSNLRMVPATTEVEKALKLKPIANELTKLANKLGENKFIQILNMLYDGLVRQVTNQPIDLLIEKWIYNDYPNLRSIQLNSLSKQNSEALMGLSKELKKIIPKTFYVNANLMNTAYTELLSKIVKYKLNRDWKKSDFFEDSKILTSFLDINNEWEPKEDYNKIDLWATHLNLNTFFIWHPFEIVPNDYINQY